MGILKIKALLLTLLLLLASTGSYAATYYISATAASNGNGLSSSTPFNNIGTALDTLQAGDTLRFLPGTYSYGIEIDKRNHLSFPNIEGQPVTFISDQGLGTVQIPYIVTYGLGNMVYDGFEISSSNANYNAVRFDGDPYGQWIESIHRSTLDDPLQTYAYGGSLPNYGAYQTEHHYITNFGRNIVLRNNHIHGSAGGDCVKVSRTTNMLIENNTIYDCGVNGNNIDLLGVYNGTIRGNTIYPGNTIANTIEVFVKGGSENIIIENNHIYDAMSPNTALALGQDTEFYNTRYDAPKVGMEFHNAVLDWFIAPGAEYTIYHINGVATGGGTTFIEDTSAHWATETDPYHRVLPGMRVDKIPAGGGLDHEESGYGIVLSVTDTRIDFTGPMTVRMAGGGSFQAGDRWRIYDPIDNAGTYVPELMAEIRNVVVRNNIIESSSPGLEFWNAYNATVHSNTFINTGFYGGGGPAGSFIQFRNDFGGYKNNHPNKKVTIVNNLFYNDGGTPLTNGRYYDRLIDFPIEYEQNSEFFIDYNLYWVNQAPGTLPPVGHINTSWVIDQNSYGVNPLLNPDYTLSDSSPAANAGYDLRLLFGNEPQYDRNGNERGVDGGYDIGAYELSAPIPCTVNADCNDGLYCNGQETCGADHFCDLGIPVVCNDGISCSTDSCNEATDSCDYVADNTVCNDNNACTNDVCSLTTGCTYTNNANSCDDGYSCTVGDVCSGGVCVSGSASNAVCLTTYSSCTSAVCDPILFSSSSTGCGNFVPTSCDQPPGVVFNLQCDSSMLDLISGISGTIGGTVSYSSDSISGSSCQVTATGNYITYPMPSLSTGVQSQDLTISVWVKTTGVDIDESYIVSQDDNYAVKIMAGDVIRFYKRTPSNGWVRVTGNAPGVTDNTWHHIVAINDGSGMRIYYDAQLIISDNTLTYPIDTTQSDTLYIGRAIDTTVRTTYIGLLDDVRIYDRALSGSEISNLFTQSGGSAPSSVCGDGSITGSEVCDGNLLNGQTCQTQGFDQGTLTCSATCLTYNTAGCSNNVAPPSNTSLGLAAWGLNYTYTQSAQVKAFPQAEGFGASATGGRGGQVIKVTNLNPSGTGSLQWALDQTGPRIIVFEVSGVINSNIDITNGDVTIAGQTAPGAGITINGRLWCGDYVDNIIMRYIRVRPEYVEGVDNPDTYDAIQCTTNSNFIFDHISVSGGADEVVGFGEIHNATMQWSTIERSAFSSHTGAVNTHNYAMLLGQYASHISIHHNLFVHHRARSPAIGAGPADVVNNVMYNVRHGFMHNNMAWDTFNIIGNYFRDGPNDDLIPFYFDDEDNDFTDTSYYISNNYVDDPSMSTSAYISNPWTDADYAPYADRLYQLTDNYAGTSFNFASLYTQYVSITISDPVANYNTILQNAGAFPRDSMTTEDVQETISRTGTWGARIPSNLMQGLTATLPPTDSDNDGMADAWETCTGLTVGTNDANLDLDSDGYRNIEEYINEGVFNGCHLQQQTCQPIHSADTVCGVQGSQTCGIDAQELGAYISRFFNGEVTITQIIEVIGLWKNKPGC